MGCFDPYCDVHAVSESGYQCFFSHQDDGEIEIEELEMFEDEVYSSAEMAAMDAAKQAKYAENQAAEFDEGEIDVEELEKFEEDEGEIRFMYNGNGVSEHVQSGVMNWPLAFGVLGVVLLLFVIANRMNTHKKGELLLGAAHTSELYGTV